MNFAQRSSCGVEGPRVCVYDHRIRKAFRPQLHGENSLKRRCLFLSFMGSFGCVRSFASEWSDFARMAV